MPQIDAPTVAEHRAQQREALLDAAEAILLESGHGALTFRALGERTGLARNSIYRYFTSRDDLIAALCERDMPRWLDELETAMAPPTGPDARVAAFVSTQLRWSPTAATGWRSSATRRWRGPRRRCHPAARLARLARRAVVTLLVRCRRVMPARFPTRHCAASPQRVHDHHRPGRRGCWADWSYSRVGRRRCDAPGRGPWSADVGPSAACCCRRAPQAR